METHPCSLATRSGANKKTARKCDFITTLDQLLGFFIFYFFFFFFFYFNDYIYHLCTVMYRLFNSDTVAAWGLLNDSSHLEKKDTHSSFKPNCAEWHMRCSHCTNTYKDPYSFSVFHSFFFAISQCKQTKKNKGYQIPASFHSTHCGVYSSTSCALQDSGCLVCPW